MACRQQEFRRLVETKWEPPAYFREAAKDASVHIALDLCFFFNNV